MKRRGLFLLLGLILLVPLSLAEGALPALSHTIAHLAEDFTADLAVHAYIAGLILVIYSVYISLRQRVSRTRKRQAL